MIRSQAPAHPEYRGYAGQIAAGTATVGDEVVVLPAGVRSTLIGIDTMDGPLAAAGVGRSVTFLLADDLDVCRGDVIVAASAPPTVTDELDATVCWLSETASHPGAPVLLKHGTRTVSAVVVSVESRFDEQNLSTVHDPGSLRLNQIGRLTLRTSEPLPVDDYTTSRRTGSFLLIDPSDGATLAAGLIGAPLAVLERGRRPS